MGEATLHIALVALPGALRVFSGEWEGTGTLYNGGGRVSYPLTYDSAKAEFAGTDTFRVNGIPAEERVLWRISPDGSEIYGEEHNHLETDPDGYWPKTFEYIWRRKR
jgi:hypothetical protein